MSDNLYNDDDEETAVPEGLVDFTAISDILVRAKDALRPLGLSLQIDPPPPVQLDGKTVVVLLPCIIRPSAKKKLDEDKASKESFNQMMANEAELTRQATIKEMQDLAANPQAIQDFIDGKTDTLSTSTCPHTRRHPSGFCLDCNEGLE